jgi:hypothetical protein
MFCRSTSLLARLGLLTSLGLFACKEASPAAEQPRSPSSAPQSAAAEAREPAAKPDVAAPGADQVGVAPATESAAQAKYSEAAFDLSIQPAGTYQVGQAGEARVVLEAKAPYHVNDKYPYKFKLKNADGLKFANLVVGKDLVKLEAMRAVVPVAFTPESAGKHAVAGQLAFSVCTDDKCLIEKRDLSLAVDVK